MKIVTTADTYLKAMPLQAAQLKQQNAPHQLIPVPSGQSLEIDSYFEYEGIPSVDTDDHVLFQLAKPIDGHPGLRWFIYSRHAKIEGAEPNNNPKDEPAPAAASANSQPAKPKDYGPTISLPGISRPVGIYEPVYFQPQPSNFTWSELTKGGSRIPVDAGVTQRIVKLCQYMDKVRTFLGNRPIRINSGYRDPATNRRVGGARQSRHLYGDAVDFYVEGENVVETFQKLKNYHTHGGLAVGNGFVHIDLRPGAPARWTYPGGPRVNLW
ncbi:MAG: D-Ala-D-Ala carboxypeptidase family metallohydrolase [Cyanobacteria bacterium J06621_11]